MADLPCATNFTAKGLKSFVVVRDLIILFPQTCAIGLYQSFYAGRLYAAPLLICEAETTRTKNAHKDTNRHDAKTRVSWRPRAPENNLSVLRTPRFPRTATAAWKRSTCSAENRRASAGTRRAGTRPFLICIFFLVRHRVAKLARVPRISDTRPFAAGLLGLCRGTRGREREKMLRKKVPPLFSSEGAHILRGEAPRTGDLQWPLVA